MLTLEKFTALPAGEQFATGTVTDDQLVVNLAGTGQFIRWVARTCHGEDGAIYANWAVYDE